MNLGKNFLDAGKMSSILQTNKSQEVQKVGDEFDRLASGVGHLVHVQKSQPVP